MAALFRAVGDPALRRARAARNHRAIRLGLVGLSATLIPALLVVEWVGWNGGGDSALVLLLWFLAWAALATSLLFFRCPQCERPFHRTGFMLSAFTTRCLHCGLSLRAANERPR